ncbi:hypothetical protein J2Y54_000560 [Sphingomonas sp. BE123]|uniref:hypothetical protein n=1 Tax=Sphingomonas sp. BE123 TaxID=2817842 RepID=UPI0028626F1D|nr:hypothetical protein [Sphingomonas sp. BE123]MDR6851067.1 hypothetical protein [Sphingomonas sp. BE123]
MIDPVEPSPARLRLEELVGFARRRLARATSKHVAAQREVAAAALQLEQAHASLAAWVKANPDPQHDLPMEEPCPKQ